MRDGDTGEQSDIPASLAFVKRTVWNHVGKLYMTEKLQVATRKLLVATSMGIFFLSRKGARTGSGAKYSSIIMKAIINNPENVTERYTAGDDHYC